MGIYQHTNVGMCVVNYSKAQIELALWASDIGLWEWQTETDDFRISDWVESYGFTAKRFPKRKMWLTRVHPEDLPKKEAALEQYLSGQSPVYEVEFRLANARGEYHWLLSRGKIIASDADSQSKKLTGIFMDITSRKNLELQQQYLATVLENVSEAVVSTDLEYRIVSWNRAAEKMYGYTAEEAIGKKVSELIKVTYLDHTREEVLSIFAQQGRWQGEVIQFHKSGTPLQIFSSVALVYDRDGRPVGIVALNRDISQQKRHESALKEYAAKLQQTNEALESFVYIASHDLKEPLRGIANYSHFVLEDHGAELPPDATDKIVTIQELAKLMSWQLDGMLLYSKFSSGELTFTEVDLNEIVADVRFQLQYTLESEHVDISIPRPLPKLRGNQTGIAQIYQNLISNAVKYNNKPQRKIEIGYLEPGETDHFGEKAETHTFFVRDNGNGIAPEYHETIFKMFKRLEKFTQGKSGAGAGLTIVKKIVERHNGKIWLRSKPGSGTTFYFTLTENSAEVNI